jgi:hypothetical protein
MIIWIIFDQIKINKNNNEMFKQIINQIIDDNYDTDNLFNVDSNENNDNNNDDSKVHRKRCWTS